MRRADGTFLRTKAPRQRPGVYVQDGVPRVLTIAVSDGDDWYCVTLPRAPAH